MGFSSLLGQPTATQTLVRALESNRVHHAYRFEGPAGVGKETAAFLLAQALVCSAGDVLGCGECSACTRAITLSSEAPEVSKHPDVVLVGRGVYPSSLLGGASEATGISVEQIRRIVLPRVRLTPHEGKAIVVIVRDADELTMPSANALLKTLEEPPRNVHFILTTSKPAKLLDTILSRTLAVRFGPLPESDLRTLLIRQEIPEELASLAGGSLHQARALAEPEAREAREAFLNALDAAIQAGHPAAAIEFAETRPDGRKDLIEILGHVAAAFALRAKQSNDIVLWSNRYSVISGAIRDIERNGSPGLVLEAMVNRLNQ